MPKHIKNNNTPRAITYNPKTKEAFPKGLPIVHISNAVINEIIIEKYAESLL